MTLRWDDPNANPIADIMKAVRRIKEDHDNIMTHRFDGEGRCIHCEVAAHNAYAYPCIDEKETNGEEEDRPA